MDFPNYLFYQIIRKFDPLLLLKPSPFLKALKSTHLPREFFFTRKLFMPLVLDFLKVLKLFKDFLKVIGFFVTFVLRGFSLFRDLDSSKE